MDLEELSKFFVKKNDTGASMLISAKDGKYIFRRYSIITEGREVFLVS